MLILYGADVILLVHCICVMLNLLLKFLFSSFVHKCICVILYMLPVIEKKQRVTLQFLAATVHYLAGF